MPRIKLRAQPAYSFQYNTVVKVRDINYGNHLGNDAVVGLLHEARIDMFIQLGCKESELDGQNTGIVMADLAVNYKEQGFLGDEIIISLDIDEIGKSGFRILYKIERGEELLVLAETGVAVYNYQAQKVAAIPQVFLESLAQWKKDRKMFTPRI